jgi:uncharacterized protein YndB with AHSA1/START domain
MSETMQHVRITKVFDAPRELVWAAGSPRRKAS